MEALIEALLVNLISKELEKYIPEVIAKFPGVLQTLAKDLFGSPEVQAWIKKEEVNAVTWLWHFVVNGAKLIEQDIAGFVAAHLGKVAAAAGIVPPAKLTVGQAVLAQASKDADVAYNGGS